MWLGILIVVILLLPEVRLDESVGGSPETADTFFQCDHVFDASLTVGNFSFPFPPSYSGKMRKKLKHEEVLFENVQCVYTFVARKGQRVMLEFDDFQLAGTIDSCDLEYVDIYSELKSASDDPLSFTPSRYCGTVSPHIRISLYNVLVLVFHSRVGKKRSEKLKLTGHYEFISDEKYVPGRPVPGHDCAFVVDAATARTGSIYSPTYPGTYPPYFHCTYLLQSGNQYDRIRVNFKDFDIYFGGEHCPYDMMTVYDGPTNRDPIIRKVCGLQQKLEVFSLGPVLLLEFNTTDPAKNDPRGYVLEYEFSDRFVNVHHLLNNQKGVTHFRGTECDVRVQSNRETVHYIHSPNYPNIYPSNTTCTYVLDGLQGDQNLEKVVLEFETANIISDKAGISESSECEGTFVGVAFSSGSMKAVLANTEESVFDAMLCERLPPTSPLMGPHFSQGPRMVLVFGSIDIPVAYANEKTPIGFRAKVEYKTDFGIPGVAVGDSNKCLFRFRDRRGFFNSPRYPANYPLDTNCTYFIEGHPGDQILLYFEQFALFSENSVNECNDFVEIYDVFRNGAEERVVLQAKHCWTIFPGPTNSFFGSHEMRVVFSSDSFGSSNGFKAFYEIRRAFKEDVPSAVDSDRRHCGQRIEARDGATSGSFHSPGFPVKYSKDLLCDWEIVARPGHQVLLRLVALDIEGEILPGKTMCSSAIIRIHRSRNRTLDHVICGTNAAVMSPMVSPNNTLRISFLTAPEKVNGLTGFNFSWTEVRHVEQNSDCPADTHYMCSYTKLCIRRELRCDGDVNCGENDDTDEKHCNVAEKDADKKTVVIAAIFSFGIFTFIFSVFCYLFVMKYRRKQKKKHRRAAGGGQGDGQPRARARRPYRQPMPMDKTYSAGDDAFVTEYDGYIPSPATSRFVHHDAIGRIQPSPPSSRHHRHHRKRADSKTANSPVATASASHPTTKIVVQQPSTDSPATSTPEFPPKSGQYTFYG